MGQNLKQRLARIRDTGKAPFPGAADAGKNSGGEAGRPAGEGLWPGWTEAGFKTLKRVMTCPFPRPLRGALSRTLAILVPDFFRAEKIPAPGDLLFFDLETSGLSGGAGTLAFLAAFGRFAAPACLEITQYLLLDYPGENDFIECVLKEFSRSVPPVVVSFNGKSFDSQILKTRCLMNGFMVPQYFHADLLHPARRLWKRVLPDCAQATIEVSVLGLSRSGDVPGALAPDIWFSFLRGGEARDLLSVCDHNARDIQGLASLFLAFEKIAAEPFTSRNAFRFDEEALALAWNEALRKHPFFFGAAERDTGERLLKAAAENGWPRAALILAKDAEWRQKDPALALRFTKAALSAASLSGNFLAGLEKRRQRLEGKITGSGRGGGPLK